MRLFKWLGLGLLAPVLSYAAVSVTINGTSYSIPQTNEKGWGTNVTNWIQAISGNTLQPSGGAFTLSAETDFGANFGLKSTYFKSRTANPASAGSFRLANLDLIKWRNSGNSSDLSLGVGSADGILAFGGVDLVNTAATQTLTNKTISFSSNTFTGTLPIANGGTGQATANASLNALLPSQSTFSGKVLGSDGTNTSWVSALTDPMTSIGDLLIRNASNVTTRLGVGTSSQVLGVSSGVPAWVPASVNAGVTAVKTTTYTIASTDDLVLGDATSAAFTETLPSASAYTGKRLIVKKVDSTFNAITLARAGSDTIDGATSTSLNTQNETLTLTSDGVSKWYVINRWYPTTSAAYTPTFGNLGTTANNNTAWHRSGSFLFVVGIVDIGTPGAGSGTISLPSGLAIDTSLTRSSQLLGQFINSADTTTTDTMQLIYHSTVGAGALLITRRFGSNGDTPMAPQNASAIIGASQTISFNFAVPIQGWN